VARAIERRPELKALRKLVGANELLRKSERNAAWPQLNLEGQAIYAQPNPRYIPSDMDDFNGSWEAGATLSWTPNQAVTGYQRSQRAKAEIERARADMGALEDAVRIEVVQALEDYKAATAAAQASQAQLKAAEEDYRVRLAMYRVGAGVMIELREADLRVTQARLASANAVIDARAALARLRRAAVLED
jgi:outer membrane protein TolC